jgi:hypothetical protein
MSDTDELPELGLDTELVCRIIELSRPALAREDEPDLSDDDVENEPALASVQEGEDDPLTAQIRSAIDSMAEPEQDRLLALFWVGAGDVLPAEWNDAVAAAADRRANQDGVAGILLGSPLLAENLEAGLEAFGRDCHGTGTESSGKRDDDGLAASGAVS